MTAKMTATRDALELLEEAAKGWSDDNPYERAVAPALAEVEEWEAWVARLRESLNLFSQDNDALTARAEAAEAEAKKSEALLQTVGSQLKYATAVIAAAEQLHPGITRQAGLLAGGTDTTS